MNFSILFNDGYMETIKGETKADVLNKSEIIARNRLTSVISVLELDDDLQAFKP